MTLQELNSLSLAAFVKRFGFAYENSEWVAAEAYNSRPWWSVEALAQSLRGVVDGASIGAQQELLAAHPDLGGRELDDGMLTESSESEQTQVGLHVLDRDRRARLRELAAKYKERFGFPCVICVRDAGSADAILALTEHRLGGSLLDERRIAIDEVHKIARFRLHDAIQEPS